MGNKLTYAASLMMLFSWPSAKGGEGAEFFTGGGEGGRPLRLPPAHASDCIPLLNTGTVYCHFSPLSTTAHITEYCLLLPPITEYCLLLHR